jgi:hypothetical protein
MSFIVSLINFEVKFLFSILGDLKLFRFEKRSFNFHSQYFEGLSIIFRLCLAFQTNTYSGLELGTQCLSTKLIIWLKNNLNINNNKPAKGS